MGKQMDLKPKYAMQTSGICHLWRSPDGSFEHTFLKLNFECEPDRYPGVVIVTDDNYEQAFAAAVQNLQRDLPALLKQTQGKPVAYWWLEQNENEVKRILSGLTGHPVFADIR